MHKDFTPSEVRHPGLFSARVGGRVFVTPAVAEEIGTKALVASTHIPWTQLPH